MIKSRISSFPNTHQSAAGTIKATIDQVIAQESLRNERKFAYVRSVVLVVSSCLDVIVFFFPKAMLGEESISPTIALISLSACLIAAGILVILQQPKSFSEMSSPGVLCQLGLGFILALSSQAV